MTKELYNLLIKVKSNCEEANKIIKELATSYHLELPKRYYMNLGKIYFCNFLINNEELKKE